MGIPPHLHGHFRVLPTAPSATAAIRTALALPATASSYRPRSCRALLLPPLHHRSRSTHSHSPPPTATIERSPLSARHLRVTADHWPSTRPNPRFFCPARYRRRRSPRSHPTTPTADRTYRPPSACDFLQVPSITCDFLGLMPTTCDSPSNADHLRPLSTKRPATLSTTRHALRPHNPSATTHPASRNHPPTHARVPTRLTFRPPRPSATARPAPSPYDPTTHHSTHYPPPTPRAHTTRAHHPHPPSALTTRTHHPRRAHATRAHHHPPANVDLSAS